MPSAYEKENPSVYEKAAYEKFCLRYRFFLVVLLWDGYERNGLEVVGVRCGSVAEWG